MQHRRWNIVGTLLISAVALSTGMGAAHAQPRPDRNPPPVVVNQQTETRADLGPVHSDMKPGVNGYKVFHPGAIAYVQAQPVDALSSDITTQAVTASSSCAGCRYGNTDAYAVSFGGMNGDHSSHSDFREDMIRVEGTLRQDGGPIRDREADTNYGTYATDPVRTYMSGTKGAWHRADSYHDFRKSGLKDTKPAYVGLCSRRLELRVSGLTKGPDTLSICRSKRNVSLAH